MPGPAGSSGKVKRSATLGRVSGEIVMESRRKPVKKTESQRNQLKLAS